MADFLLAKGVHVPNIEGIHECYIITERIRPSDGSLFYTFTVNVSIDKLRPLLTSFIEGLGEPCFFICETGASRQEEATLRKSENDPFHNNVYYKDGCSRSELMNILEAYGEWFIQDGMSCFGFASHNSKDEIYVGRYKVTNLFTNDPRQYESLLEHFDIPREDKMRTVWDSFTSESPGECWLVTIEGQTVHNIIAQLLKDGLYLAEQRET
jgi:hypothetical protein